MPPLPQPTAFTQPFWDATKAGHIVVQQCSDCQKRFFVPEPLCVACGSKNWSWVKSVGTGNIYTMSVVYQAISPDQPVPFVLAVIDMDDGWSILTHILTANPGEVSIGARVQLAPTKITEEITLPTFKLA